MALTQIAYDTGGGWVTLPEPAEFATFRLNRGGHLILADGSASVDTVAAGKYRLTIEWRNVSVSDATTITTFYGAAYGTAITFRDPNGTSFTNVMIEPDTELELNWHRAANSSLIFDARIRLRQQ